MANYTDVFPDTVALEASVGTNTGDITALQNGVFGELHGTVDNVSLTATIGTVVYLTTYADSDLGGDVTVNTGTGVIGIATAGKYQLTTWVKATLDATKSYNVYCTVEQDDNGTVTSEVIDAMFPTNASETLGVWRVSSIITIPVTGSVTNLRIGLSADSAVAYTGLKGSFSLRLI